MNATTKTPLVIAFVITVMLFLLFGSGMMTGTIINGGMMGSGRMSGGGISWMWISTLFTFGLGVIIGWVSGVISNCSSATSR